MDFRTCIEKVGDHLKKGLPFVIYRASGQKKGRAIFQENNKLIRIQNFLESGFVFAPFNSDQNPILLRPDELFEWLSPENREDIPKTIESSDFHEGDKEQHIDLVKKGIEQIQSGKLEKVVLSRKIVRYHKDSPLNLFQRLLNYYPSAFCYMWHHPKVGLWLGATPETLLHSSNGKLSTMSLAGTQPYDVNKQPTWKEKEIDEQELVTNYIMEVLQPHVADLVTKPRVAERAGNVWHLRTEIRGSLKPSKLRSVINALHPTPAVCGLPTDTSKTFILDFEKYDRAYYTGFLGELNIQSHSSASLYVNLRCMELKEKVATIYVGGGITKDSDPELEWEETQLKSATMISVLASSKE